MQAAPDQLVEMLRRMHRIRAFELKAQELYREGLARGSFLGALHSYEGQEAVAVGACACLRRDDYVVSSHRGHGHCIAKGADSRRMMAELLGKETGYSRGRGGSMHIFSVEEGLLGGNGIVGGGIPLALGAAFSGQYRGTGQVAVCFFGEGGACQGTFHESLNLAALWQLPVVFICENNLWAATTPVTDAMVVRDIGTRAAGYGCPGEVVDGNDVLAVHQVAAAAVARAREGAGPTLIECKTYRHRPHCMVIPEHRSREELDAWHARDPIPRFERHLLKGGTIARAERDDLVGSVQVEMEDAAAFARESPLPDPSSVSDGLWA